LHRQDLVWVRGADVVNHPDGTVVVTVVGGPRPRRVTALDTYADHITDCANRTQPSELLGRRNATGPTLDRIICDRSVPRVVPARLRSTWFVMQLNLRTPLGVLLPVAGMNFSRTLDELLEYADPITETESTNLLRGRDLRWGAA
jgi:hypothetical protein